MKNIDWNVDPIKRKEVETGEVQIWADVPEETASEIIKVCNAYAALQAENAELAYQLDIALKTLDQLRGGFEQELSGDTCENIDKIIAKGKQALTRPPEVK